MNLDAHIDYPAEYYEYFRLFNERDFYEAHEVLEDLWVIEVGEVRNFYKGLIMIAAAAFQWKRGAYRGASRLYLCAERYLSNYPEIYEGLQVTDFQSQMKSIFAPLIEKGKEASPPNDNEWPMIHLQAGEKSS